MLKPAYLETTNEELNKLISEGNYKYLNLQSYVEYNQVELDSNELNEIQRVSVDDEGNILGYFSVRVDTTERKITNTYFVKFKYKYSDVYNKIYQCEEEAYKDFKAFIELMFNHPIYKRVNLYSIVENPANELYEKWLDKYNGKRFLMSNYTMLPDGKMYDVYNYWFDRSEINEY